MIRREQDHSWKITRGDGLPSVIRLTTISCSSSLFGNKDSLVRATQLHSHSMSPFRTIVCKLGARSSKALINVNCCSSGLKPTIWSSFSSQFLELCESISHSGFFLSGNTNFLHMCRGTLPKFAWGIHYEFSWISGLKKHFPYNLW